MVPPVESYYSTDSWWHLLCESVVRPNCYASFTMTTTASVDMQAIGRTAKDAARRLALISTTALCRSSPVNRR